MNKLSHLNVVLPSTEAAAAAAAAVVKDALAGLGTVGREGQPAADGTAGAGAGIVAKGADDVLSKSTMTQSGGLTSATAVVEKEKEEGGVGHKGKERDDLGRSIRDTVLTMRGLAKLYPLSHSFR